VLLLLVCQKNHWLFLKLVNVGNLTLAGLAQNLLKQPLSYSISLIEIDYYCNNMTEWDWILDPFSREAREHCVLSSRAEEELIDVALDRSLQLLFR